LDLHKELPSLNFNNNNSKRVIFLLQIHQILKE